MTKKKTTKKTTAPAVTITGCSVGTFVPPSNEHDAAVTVALARAAEANAIALGKNAEAIATVATKAKRVTETTMGTGIAVGKP